MKISASYELSKELYELSDWSGEDYGGYYMGDPLVWATDKMSGGRAKHQLVWSHTWSKSGNYIFVAPCYELGYLLRKVKSGGGVISDSKTYTARRPAEYGAWPVGYKDPLGGRIGWTADTPEDAMCSMFIDLFKVGILSK